MHSTDVVSLSNSKVKEIRLPKKQKKRQADSFHTSIFFAEQKESEMKPFHLVEFSFLH